MKERIQKILAARGLCSRRTAEAWITEGRVTCNGKLCTLGDSADPAVDQLLVDGKEIPAQGSYLYIMLNKPRGYVTTLSDEKGRKNAAQLVADCGQRVYPVGRLDMDSEGLLLFTNDGQLANRLMHPSHEVQKVYRVTVSDCDAQKVEALRRPIELDGYRIKAPEVGVLRCGTDGKAELSVTIHEGRNRQVRRMCAAAGMQVHRLIRVAEGSVRLGAVPVGKWRYLTEEEISALQE